jgi:hypothetical protein
LPSSCYLPISTAHLLVLLCLSLDLHAIAVSTFISAAITSAELGKRLPNTLFSSRFSAARFKHLFVSPANAINGSGPVKFLHLVEKTENIKKIARPLRPSLRPACPDANHEIDGV